MKGARAATVTLIVAALALTPAAAVATPPGANGPLVWQSRTGTSGGGLLEIWIMEPDGSGKQALTDNAFNDERPAISADGEKVAFSSFRPSDGTVQSFEIYVMDSGGGQATALTDDASTDMEPAFSPDGTKILYTGDGELWTVPVAGGTPTNITNTPGAFECCAEFSPDGTKITYVLNGRPSGDPSDPYDPNNIWVANANGTNPVNLTDDTDMSAQNLGPTWSPEGERIAYAGSDSGDYEITVMDADGTNSVPLTNDSVNEINPVFSPDGSSIGFTFPSVDNEIVTIPDEPTATGNFDFLTVNDVEDDYAGWAPAGAGSQPPETTITKRPDDVISKPKATYGFVADPAAGASFQCSLDGKPFKACTSQKTYRRLDKGRHRFKVRARNSAGADPTPAKDGFKVKR